MIGIPKQTPDRQSDFWLGDWEVTWGAGLPGSNHLARILDGRVIQENSDAIPALPFRGMSPSVYVEKRERWRTTWVENDGDYWAFEGGADGGQMVLATDDVADGRPIKLRMLFYNIDFDEMDWRWERSKDGCQTWGTRWEIHYRRRRSAE
jgi:hypothetical protein